MFKNYLKVTIRNLKKNKLFSFVNILGFAIGIASFILIILFVEDELTYDSHNRYSGRIFRVNAHYKVGENRFNLANSPIPLAGVLASEYPEIEKTVRILNESNVYVKKGNNYIKEEKFFYADSTLFEIFTIDFQHGDSKKALTEPNSVVITTGTAEKYFSNKNPVGEIIILSNGMQFLITGIVKPVPKNSHFEFDFIASYNSLPGSSESNWFGEFVHTYVLTHNVVTEKVLNEKIFSVAEKHLGPIIKAAFGVSYQEFLNNGNDFSFVFVPLRDIYLHSEVFNEFKETGDMNIVYLYSAIAVFILIIACINFINLSTAKSAKRANEIGVRKVFGSNKILLVKQFLSESVILCFIAIVFSVAIAELVLPWFNDLTDKNLSLNLFSNFFTIPVLLVFTLLLGITAGLYPALLLASFKPVLILKTKFSSINNKGILRRGLVVFQFAASIVLFVGTFVIYSQMQYIKNKNLGFNKEQVLIIQDIDDLQTQQFAFADNIKSNPDIFNASLSQGLPGYNLTASILRKEGESNENHTLIVIPVDYNYLDTYKMKMKEGRFFNKEIITDSSGIILNESAVKKLNYKDPLNSKLIYDLGEESNNSYTIIGVVKDFHLESLKDEIRPAAFVLLKKPEANYLSVKISPYNISGTIRFLSDQWREFGQNKPLEFSFYDENFYETYRSEIQAEKVFSIFAILAIVIASLGLFGLAAFTAEQRTKEIGIRKVLGASISKVVLMLSKEFLILVTLANLIAWPLAYFIMTKWLEDFTYRIEIELWTFILAGLLTLLIAFLTVSFQAIKAATANPVEALKYE